MYRVLLDTNVIVAALRSPHGSAAALLRQLADDRFEIVTSVALHLEYEEQLSRLVEQRISTAEQAEAVMDFISLVAILTDIRFRLRPALSDPDDEFALELAFAAGVEYIVTHNRRDFGGSKDFGVKVISPRELVLCWSMNHEHRAD